MFYCGWGKMGPKLLSGESHLLVLGPPRCGKTTGMVIPNLVGAESAVVVTSTKADLLVATAAERQRAGRVWLFDPMGAIEPPPGVTRLNFSPVALADSFSRALLMSRAMVRSSVARSGSSLTFWEERAEATIAPTLLGAHLGGLSMAKVMDMIETKSLDSLLTLLGAKGELEASRTLASVLGSADRERSGVLSTAAGILSAYRMPEVLSQAGDANFDPLSFVSSRETIYVVAPASVQDVLAPLVVGLIWSIRDAAYAGVASEQLRSQEPQRGVKVKLLLDEMANIAPIYDLGAILSEGASQGVLVLGVLQDLSQAHQRWPVTSQGFLTMFQNVVIYPGIADARTLADLSSISGEKMVMLPSQGNRRTLASASHRSISGQLRPLVAPHQFAHLERGHAYLLEASQGFSRIAVPAPNQLGSPAVVAPVARGIRRWGRGRD